MSQNSSLVEAAHEIQSVCHEHGLGFCFIGGLAVLRWGEPRFTRDVDLTILADYGDEPSVTDVLLDKFDGRLEATRDFALHNRVVLLFADNRVPIDVALGALPFEHRSIVRSSTYLLAGRHLRTCSAEDLIVHKVFAGRDHDWLDVEGVVTRQHDLNTALIVEELTPLLAAKQATESIDRLLEMLR